MGATKITLADDFIRMPYEMSRLYGHYGGGNVDAVSTLAAARRLLRERRSIITIIDPLTLTKKLREVKEIVVLAKVKSDYVVLVESAVSLEDLGFRRDVDYNIKHTKPYCIDRLIPEMHRYFSVSPI